MSKGNCDDGQCCHPVLYTEHGLYLQNNYRTIQNHTEQLQNHLYILQMVLYIKNHCRTIGWQHWMGLLTDPV